MPKQDDPPAETLPLGDLYKVAVDEYRFNVQLGWDRAKFLVGLHTALFGAVVALLRTEAGHPVPIATLSLIGCAAALVGVNIIDRSHRYYRRAVYKKTLLEDRLGLTRKVPGYDYAEATLAIGTTKSQAQVQQILNDTAEWLSRKIRIRKVVGQLKAFLWGVLVLHACNIAWQSWQLWG